MSKEAMKLALEALEELTVTERTWVDIERGETAITALREALAKPDFWEGYVPEPVKSAQQALDKKAENARELGLDYEPAQQEPVAHAVISGALFDFMGWLTSRKERLVLSSADNASPAVEAITEFAKMRGLSLNDAKVQDWNTPPPAQRTWVGLTDEERVDLWKATETDNRMVLIEAIEAKLRSKNEDRI